MERARSYRVTDLVNVSEGDYSTRDGNTDGFKYTWSSTWESTEPCSGT